MYAAVYCHSSYSESEDNSFRTNQPPQRKARLIQHRGILHWHQPGELLLRAHLQLRKPWSSARERDVSTRWKSKQKIVELTMGLAMASSSFCFSAYSSVEASALPSSHEMVSVMALSSASLSSASSLSLRSLGCGGVDGQHCSSGQGMRDVPLNRVAKVVGVGLESVLGGDASGGCFVLCLVLLGCRMGGLSTRLYGAGRALTFLDHPFYVFFGETT